MTIVNTTFFVEAELSENFHNWLVQTYLPEVNRRFSARVFRVLAQQDPSVRTFALQLETASADEIHIWENLYVKRLKILISEKFGEKVMAVATMLEQI